MKLQFKKTDLINAINIVSKAVPSKTTMSILECILVDASNGKIELVGNDAEFGIQTVCNGTIIEAGKVALEAKIFSEIIRRLPESKSPSRQMSVTIPSSPVRIQYLRSPDVMVMNSLHFRRSIKTSLCHSPSSCCARLFHRRSSPSLPMTVTKR